MHRRQVLQLSAALPVGLVARTNRGRSPLNAPDPKFKVWDSVWHEHTVDDELDPVNDGKTFRVFGVIIGMVFNPDFYYERGWIYYVMTYEPKSLAQPWRDDSCWHESEISLLNASEPIFGEFELSRLPRFNSFAKNCSTHRYP